jgi:hypothetical protein
VERDRSFAAFREDRPVGLALEDRSALEGRSRDDLESHADGLTDARRAGPGTEERLVGLVGLVDERCAIGREQEFEAAEREADLAGREWVEAGARQGGA